MKAVRLHVKGEFDDAFVYMGRLLLLTADRSIQSVPLTSTLDQIAKGRARRALRILFERNDEMNAQSLIQASGTASNSNRELSRLADEELYVEPVVESEIKLGISYAAPLDLLTYYRRLYIATDQGLYSQDLDFDGSKARRLGESRRRTEPACLAVTARYGTVNASCEDDGLFQVVDDFGWLDSGKPGHMKRIAPRSRRTSWLNQGFANYVTNTTVSLFGATTRPIPKREGDEQEKRAITGVRRLEQGSEAINRRLEEVHIPADDVIHIWSSLGGLFVQARAGLYFLRFSTDSEGLSPEPADAQQPAMRIGDGVSTVLSAGTFGLGTVVESEEAVVAFERWQTLVISRRPAISVRAFPSSRWYRRLVAIVLENEVLIVSVLRDYMLQLEG